MSNIAIHSNKTVTPQGLKACYVLLSGGIITDVTDALPQGFAGVLIDVENKVLMPGVIDPHVHINEPGRTNWEGFNTATKAAIAGGITTLVDMPLNASPVTTTVKAFKEKLAVTKNQLHTNCGFWGGIIPSNHHEIGGLIKSGVLGFKAFLTPSGIDEFPNATEADLRKAMPIIASHGLPLLVHCELSEPMAFYHQPSTVDSRRLYSNYLASRPKQWEDEAITMMIRLCEEFNCRTHIVHLSSANSIAQIAKAKQKGLPLTVETGQHYLYFNAEDIPDGRTEYKCAPPIREAANNEQLWQALKDGIVDFVATDHSPAPPDLKQMETGDFMKAWGGISSIQFALPVLWTGAKKINATLTDIVKWLCENPAKLIGKENTKGKIEKNFDADLIVWDDEKTFVVTEGVIHHKHKITPYLNEILTGVVTQTWLAGEKVFEDGIFLHLNKGKLLI